MICLSFGNVHSSEVESEYNDSSIQKIIACEDGIYLSILDNWFKVDALQSTPNGIIVLHQGNWTTLHELNGFFVWTCSICGCKNVQEAMICRNIDNHQK
jgi:hypothetical protein